MDYDRFPNMDECKSEVARLRYQIEQEYRAAELAMNGFAAGTARHDFITAKMERVGECRNRLGAFCLCGLDHQGLLDDEREVDGRRVKAQLHEPLGDI